MGDNCRGMGRGVLWLACARALLRFPWTGIARHDFAQRVRRCGREAHRLRQRFNRSMRRPEPYLA